MTRYLFPHWKRWKRLPPPFLVERVVEHRNQHVFLRTGNIGHVFLSPGCYLNVCELVLSLREAELKHTNDLEHSNDSVLYPQLMCN